MSPTLVAGNARIDFECKADGAPKVSLRREKKKEESRWTVAGFANDLPE